MMRKRFDRPQGQEKNLVRIKVTYVHFKKYFYSCYIRKGLICLRGRQFYGSVLQSSLNFVLYQFRTIFQVSEFAKLFFAIQVCYFHFRAHFILLGFSDSSRENTIFNIKFLSNSTSLKRILKNRAFWPTHGALSISIVTSNAVILPKCSIFVQLVGLFTKTQLTFIVGILLSFPFLLTRPPEALFGYFLAYHVQHISTKPHLPLIFRKQ